MKRTERHRLKDNEIAALLETVIHTVEERQREIVWGVGIALVVVAIGGGYFYWQSRTNEQAGMLLAEGQTIMDAPVAAPTAQGVAAGQYASLDEKLEAALTRFQEAAEAYPKTTSGIMARYEAAAILSMLGRADEASAEYAQVLELARPGDVYTSMARLGKARADAQAARYDEAITALQTLSDEADAAVPTDAALMELGRTYQLAGRTDDASATFQRLVAEFPESPFAPDAEREASALEANPS